MKKKMYVIAAILVVLAMLGTGTLAYFTTRVVTHNVITTGAVSITLEEDFQGSVQDQNGNRVLNGVMPGQAPVKKVKVTNNLGSADAWIRIGVKITVTDSQGKDMTAQAKDKKVFNIPITGTGWVAGEEKDGIQWYYYEKELAPGKSTTNLFENLNFAGAEMGNEYQNATFTVSVEAQAVQTANNPIPSGGNVTAVQGWPTT